MKSKVGVGAAERSSTGNPQPFGFIRIQLFWCGADWKTGKGLADDGKHSCVN
jgi:hypothetical protein